MSRARNLQSSAGAPDVESRPSNPAWDALLDRATARLSRDPELQREVRMELLAHLEDAAAEHVAAGATPQAAIAQAQSELGDAGDLAERLWNVHRHRLRLRTFARRLLYIALVPLT